MRSYAAGDNAVLIELGEGVSGGTLAAAADAVRDLAGIESCTLGHASLYVVFDRVTEAPATGDILGVIKETCAAAEAASVGRRHVFRVSVHPDCAPDLPLLEVATGQSRASLAREMRALRFTVRYSGFRPGFAYLEGLPVSWRLPRRERPRARVEAGSFGIAGSMAGFYPAASPGGWNIVGRTDARLWDPTRNPPNLLFPGDQVQIEPVDEMLAAAEISDPSPERCGEPVATFVAAGQSTVIASARRAERHRFGLPPSGPFDEAAAASANRGAGNRPDSPIIECAMVGPAMRFNRATLLSWAGSRIKASLNGRAVNDPNRIAVSAGDLLEIGRITDGLRGALAIRGGAADPSPRFSVELRLVRLGDVLSCLDDTDDPATASLNRKDRLRIRIRRGPHEVADELFAELLRKKWHVTNDLNRVGIRLICDSPSTGIPADLPSCGMQFGTVQWHPGGDLVAMGPDHPVTGGYLQVMTVLLEERWKLAQLMPGDEVTWNDE